MAVSWADDAACARPGMNPEWWFPLTFRDLKRAVTVCAGCPVLRACAQDEIDRDARDRACVRGGVYNNTSHSLAQKEKTLKELRRVVRGGVPKVPRRNLPV